MNKRQRKKQLRETITKFELAVFATRSIVDDQLDWIVDDSIDAIEKQGMCMLGSFRLVRNFETVAVTACGFMYPEDGSPATLEGTLKTLKKVTEKLMQEPLWELTGSSFRIVHKEVNPRNYRKTITTKTGVITIKF